MTIEQQLLEQIEATAAAANQPPHGQSPQAQGPADAMPDDRSDSPARSSSSLSPESEYEGSGPSAPRPLPPPGAVLFPGQMQSTSAGYLCVAAHQALHLIGAPAVHAVSSPLLAATDYITTIAAQPPLATIQMTLSQANGQAAGVLYLLRYPPPDAATEPPSLGAGDLA